MAEALRGALLPWFDASQRDLPWRRTKDAYAVWVSEVMLQQTQVDRVIGYWDAFLERFPTVRALAKAELADVLARWSGLGYYSRARNLHRAAQEIVARHGGTLPKDVAALRTLPGFGRYTAGAVASIAFDLEAPLVDGNVARVFSRVLAIEGAPGDKAREATLWTAAETLVRGPRPGDLNQSLMELGATVCLPRAPSCLLCPAQKLCRALAQGRVGELPWPKKAARKKRLELAVAVSHQDGAVVLARRQEGGLFGGLWEMPAAAIGPNPGDAALETLLGERAAIGPELLVMERTLTHRQLVLHLHPVDLPRRLPPVQEPYVEWRWVTLAETRQLGMASAMTAALELAVPRLLAAAAPPSRRPIPARRHATGAAPRAPRR